MVFQFPAPGQLSKSNFLVRQIRTVPVHTVLVVAIETELEHPPVLEGQLVVPKKLPPSGLDALPVHLIAPPVVFVPVHFASPPVLIYISSHQGEESVVLPLEVPLAENGNPILQGDIGEMVPIVVDRVLIIEIVQSQ